MLRVVSLRQLMNKVNRNYTSLQRRLIVTLIFVGCCRLACFGETMISICYVADKPFGEAMFTLYEGTQVACGVMEKGWGQVLFKAWIKKEKVYQGIRILQGAKLYNSRGKECGRVLVEMNPYRTIEENDTCYMMEVAGFGQADCIDPASVVEKQLGLIFRQPLISFPIDSFMGHIIEFGYERWRGDSTIESYLLMETDIVKPRPGIRVVLVFEGGRAVAVFYKRPIVIRHFEAVAVTPRYSLLYLGSFNETFKKRMSDILIPHIDALY
jgi:hypothetical protein